MQLYFIAILPPQEIAGTITEIKKSFSIYHQSSRALKSPPHITLRPPFKMFKEREQELQESLTLFASSQKKFVIELDGFGHFRNDVIYIKPLEQQRLTDLHNELNIHIENKNKFPALAPYPAFHPHITVAFRDLSTKEFTKAWEIYQRKEYRASFEVGNIYLLKQIKQVWEVYATFPFISL